MVFNDHDYGQHGCAYFVRHIGVAIHASVARDYVDLERSRAREFRGIERLG